MIYSVLETRRVADGLYNITLSINENDYFTFYDGLDEEAASDLLKNYLRYRADDGRPKDIKIRHNKNEHIVTINANLYYTGNEKTDDMYNMHGHIRQ